MFLQSIGDRPRARRSKLQKAWYETTLCRGLGTHTLAGLTGRHRRELTNPDGEALVFTAWEPGEDEGTEKVFRLVLCDVRGGIPHDRRTLHGFPQSQSVGTVQPWCTQGDTQVIQFPRGGDWNASERALNKVEAPRCHPSGTTEHSLAGKTRKASSKIPSQSSQRSRKLRDGRDEASKHAHVRVVGTVAELVYPTLLRPQRRQPKNSSRRCRFLVNAPGKVIDDWPGQKRPDATFVPRRCVFLPAPRLVRVWVETPQSACASGPRLPSTGSNARTARLHKCGDALRHGVCHPRQTSCATLRLHATASHPASCRPLLDPALVQNLHAQQLFGIGFPQVRQRLPGRMGSREQ